MWCCARNQTKNTRKICVWMPAILVVVKKYRSVVIRPISDPVVRKRRNWSAIQNFMPAVGLLKLHTLFSIAFASFWFVLKRKLPIIWPSFNLPVLLLFGVKSYTSIVNFGIGSNDLTQLEQVWYEGNVENTDHYNWTRYYALNLHSVFYRGTVEWRCFNSTLHAGKVAAYVNLCLAISAQAIAQRSTVMRKTQSENELFTFRVWLVRLGLNGEEFKHTRDHLLAHLEGDRAWRHDKDSYPANQKKKKRRESER